MAATRISEDVTIEGDLSCPGPVEVWGRIDGDVVAAKLAIMTGGRIDGNIEADELLVRGEHTGTATCSSVEIFEAAVVTATITSKTLACEAGATISGKFEIIGESRTPGAARPDRSPAPAKVS